MYIFVTVKCYCVKTAVMEIRVLNERGYNIYIIVIYVEQHTQHNSYYYTLYISNLR